MAVSAERTRAILRASWLAAGPALWPLALLLAPASIPSEARHVLGIGAWMAIWWLTEPVPLAATSLLPIVLFPLAGVRSARDAAAPYANELVFLFLAGFLLAAALEKWNAHGRIAYGIVSAVGGGPRRVIFGVMLATAFISMWISNTATAAMMFPIALAVGTLFGTAAAGDASRTALMLGVGYAASIGGMATLIGTPPNLIFAGAARELAGREVSFAEFLMVGIPVAAVLLPLCWGLLVLLFPGEKSLGADARRALAERRAALGAFRGGEARTVAIFLATVAAWLFRERKDLGSVTVPGLADLAPGLTDASVGLAGAILLFVVSDRSPAAGGRPLLTWKEAREIPWGILLLFGGGLSLAAAMESSGLARWMGGGVAHLGGSSRLLVYAGLAGVVLLLSELASNTAVAAMAMPIAASLAPAVGEPPVALMLVAALAASAGFALPVATPPNAIVFGSGQIRVRQMAKAGGILDVLAIAVVVAAVLILYPLVFD